MSNHERVRALLRELLPVDEFDLEHMPVNLLVSMHRETLRSPMRRLAALCEARFSSRQGMLRHLTESYPELRGGGCFEGEEVERLLRVHGLTIDVDVMDGFDENEEIGSETMELLLLATDEWQVYEPLSLLYTVSLGAALAEIWLPLLEAELSITPQVSDLILDMAHGRIEIPAKTGFLRIVD